MKRTALSAKLGAALRHGWTRLLRPRAEESIQKYPRWCSDNPVDNVPILHEEDCRRCPDVVVGSEPRSILNVDLLHEYRSARPRTMSRRIAATASPPSRRPSRNRTMVRCAIPSSLTLDAVASAADSCRRKERGGNASTGLWRRPANMSISTGGVRLLIEREVAPESGR
jgi:hypothetical protein